MRQLRKENGQFAGLSEQFTLMEKLTACFGIALLLSSFYVADYVRNYANVVLEVWANMDNAAYTNYVRGYATPTPEDPAVIMERIAKCESGGTHYRQDGTLVKNINKNGTIDFGKFQINSAWEAKAASMGHNIYLPEGNEAFAYWLL